MARIILLLALLTACSSPKSTTIESAALPWWQPSSATPIAWHWQLSQGFQVPRDLKPRVKVYDFDPDYAAPDAVQQLKAAVPGAIAICYIDVGVYETYRPDAPKFIEAQERYRADSGNPNARLWGNKDQGWNGSYWLDVRQQQYLLPIMEARIAGCKARGFDAVEPDETEVWDNNPGFPISMAQNHAYTRAIADLVHSYGMSVGLKGNNSEAALLEPYHDWALSEQCFQYSECKALKAFTNAGKAVFIIEYKSSLPSASQCNWANANHMNAARRDLNLVGPSAAGYKYKPCKPDGLTVW